ncbi:MAG: carboxypeptidase regulatory-like domain-containing protein, partial [Muribaculaceae bacterium]|nr:carboxypeptidase regulatory-like domain-containing protein [Muribaculaceae bacterium]
AYTFTPAESGEYYLGFHSLSPFDSNATLIDDVKVSAGPTAGFLGMAAIHGGFTDMRKGTISVSYDIMNNGKAPLEVGFKECSPELSVEGLPKTIAVERSGEVIISFTPTKPGNTWSYLTFTTSDPAHPEVTIGVYTETADVPVTGYVAEDFEKGNPVGWELTGRGIFTDFYPGHNGPRCYYTRSIYTLEEEGPIGFTTNYVEMGDDPRFSLWYKLTDCDLLGQLAGPTPADAPVMQVSVSEDNGWTYTPVWELGQDSGRLHNPSSEFQQLEIALPEYKNKICRVKFEIWNDRNPLENDFIFLADDVKVGTPSTTDLRVSALRGGNSMIAGEKGTLKVDVLNLGTVTSSEATAVLTDAAGNTFGTAKVPSVEPGATVKVDIPFVSETPGAYAVTAVINVEDDANPDDNTTEPLPVSVVTPDAENVIISGTKAYSSALFPVYLGNYETATQTIYTANEIGSDCGQINSITWTSVFEQPGYIDDFEVFVAETDREDYSDEGWIADSEMTKVFEGSFFVEAGSYDFTIPFDRPFEYNGRNLVVMTRKIGDSLIVTRRFLTYASDVVKSVCCAETTRGIMVANGYKNRLTSREYPAVTVNITLPDNGMVTGCVRDAEGIVAGAKVMLEGTNRYTFSDANGNYEMRKVRTGERSIGAEKFAYYPSEGNQLTVTDGEKAVRDIMLTPYPKSVLSGKVHNAAGEPIAQARVY